MIGYPWAYAWAYPLFNLYPISDTAQLIRATHYRPAIIN